MQYDDGLARWRGKTALVTGASSGIGEAVAEALAERGINLVVAARRMDRLESLRARLERKGVHVLPVACDLSKEGDVMGLFGTLRKEVGGVDILVNNAGLTVRQEVANGSPEAWHRILDVNVVGAGLCMREALKDMRQRDPAAIINVSSVSAYVATVGRGSGMYTASKHALRALTETLRMELVAEGSRVKVGCISPGGVSTEIQTREDPDDNIDGMSPLASEMLEAEDIAGAVLYMLSTPARVQVNDITLRPIGQMV